MSLKDLKISTLMILGFSVMLLLVILLGVVSYRQSHEIHLQTEMIYEHPLKVKNAVTELEANILLLRIQTRDLLLARHQRESEDALQSMAISESNALKQFDTLYARYLGPKKDVDVAYKAFFSWNEARKGVVREVLSNGSVDKESKSLSSNGNVGILLSQLTPKIEKINDFATAKGASLYESSNVLRASLRTQLIWLVIVIILLILFINYYILQSIRKPIEILTDTTTRFREGDMNARSLLETKNEFGVLSDSFNIMVEQIRKNSELSAMAVQVSESMLIEDNSHSFFRKLLPTIAKLTNSQMAAVYLLTDDKKQYEHYESIGLAADATKYSFAADTLEGEFGPVLTQRNIHSVKNIPLKTNFTFQTVSGTIIPREIMTIPIIAGDEIIAILSLASVRNYTEQANELIHAVFDVLTARIDGILTYRKLRKSSKQMELQNDELEAQKNELRILSSDLVKQNHELEAQKKQLSEASQLKTNFLSNMSHELRTPLNSVIALSGVLNRRLVGRLPDEEYSFLEVIERNGKHLLTLINDILDISRIESGREEVEISKFNANELITEVVNMIHPQAVQKGIELIHTAADTEMTIHTDFEKCRHILQNLVANAVKFTEKGIVQIDVLQTSFGLDITVRDSGIGIASEHLEHIFDEFRQADGSMSRRFGGTGLGLAIARKYANLLGGDITVSSEVDKGSVFTLSLPLSYQENDRNVDVEKMRTEFSQPNYQQPTVSVDNKTILLVEDSEAAIIQVRDFLEESGYTTLVTQNGQEALAVVDTTIPDAIILDLMMPGIDGFEVLRKIRESELTMNIPVLILTAKHITKEELKFLKRNNVHQLIQKGNVNKNELLNAISEMTTAKNPEASTPKPTTPKKENFTQKPVVLVVEDNQDNMITVKAILADMFTILEAVDGLEGISIAKQKKPDLILMDISLPGIDGIEAFKVIRKNIELENIPIVALTASALDTEREIILAHGFDDYVAKPIDEKLLFKTINKVLYGK